MFSELGDPREPVLYTKNGKVKVRIMDGATPGGKPLGGDVLTAIDTPTIVSPLDDSVGISASPVITGSPYAATNITNNRHVATRWQIATDALFTTLVYDSGEATTNKESIDLSTVPQVLVEAIEHFVRVKHYSIDDLESEWSPVVSFTTGIVLPDTQLFKLTASDGAASDVYGNVVVISDDKSTVVVGAYNENSSAGTAYIYKWNGSSWVETILRPASRSNQSQFGKAIDVSSDGNKIIIGAPGQFGANQYNRRVYVFTWNGSSWVEELFLTTGETPFTSLGSSVALSGNGEVRVVGDPGYDYSVAGFNYRMGKCRIYRWNGTGWARTDIVIPGVHGTYPGYNWSLGRASVVSEDGDTVVSSATGHEAGFIYVMKWNGSGWPVTRIDPSDGLANDQFGHALAVNADGTRIAVGAYAADPVGANSGAVYIYDWNGTTWDETKLMPNDHAAGDQFGRSISISADGNTLAIGSLSNGGNGTNSGAVYLFVYTGGNWVQTRIVSTDIFEQDQFGGSVSIASDASLLIAGAQADDDAGLSSGSAYIFE
jgi:hypothetical protein